MNTTEQCVQAYRKHKHLGLAATDVGIPWQTVYVHLKRAGEPVCGDKSRYGSDTDKLAAKAERIFKELVPYAKDQNRAKFQSKYDFIVKGYKIDVKCSTLRPSSKGSQSLRWAVSVKKQESDADFFVCIFFSKEEKNKYALIPGELARCRSTINFNKNKTGKWWAYEVKESEIKQFFDSLPELN